MVFLKELFEKVDFEKIQQRTKKHEKLPRGQRVMALALRDILLIMDMGINRNANSNMPLNLFSLGG